ncbi:MAG: cytochrome C oxidase subunit IV family protein [Methanobacteriota archaeon]
MAETATADRHGVRAEVKKRPYVPVFATLAIVTLVELNVQVFGIARSLQIGVLLILATLKGALVVAYYMHMRYEPRWLAFIPLGALVLISALILALIGTGVAPKAP